MKRSHHGSDQSCTSSPRAEMAAAAFGSCPRRSTTRCMIAEMCGGHGQPDATSRCCRASRCRTASDEDGYFRELARKGLDERFEEFARVGKHVDATRYRERLEMECDVIAQDGLRRLLPDRPGLHQLGQATTACRSVPAAARARARSSRTRCASPTSIRSPHGLLFERFLNPERVSMPDFDVDFCMDRRDEVIDYVREQVRRRAASGKSPRSTCSRAAASCATSAA